MSEPEKIYGGYIPKKLDLCCIRCEKKLDAEHCSNASKIPIVYGGVVFRSSGQFGSTVLDCGVGIPREFEPEVQIILCDECVKKNAERINMWTTPRPVMEIILDYDGDTRERLTDWSDYTTYAAMRDAHSNQKSHTPRRAMGVFAELEDAEKAGDVEKVASIKKQLNELHESLKKQSEEYNKLTEEEKTAIAAQEKIEHAMARKKGKEVEAELLRLYPPKD